MCSFHVKYLQGSVNYQKHYSEVNYSLLIFVCLFGVYFLAISKIILGWVLNYWCPTERPFRTQYPYESYYPDIEVNQSPPINAKGPFTQDGDRWATIERSKIGPISQPSLKSNENAISVWDPCALIDLSVDDHWEIIEGSWQLLGDRWALFERSLRHLTIFTSLNDLSTIATPV